MNEYGLDKSYFKKNLEKLICEIDNYTPSEMERALRRLSVIAHEQANRNYNVSAIQAFSLGETK